MPTKAITPPSAEEIVRLFRHPAVVTARPALLAAVEVLKRTRGFDWSAEGAETIAACDGPVLVAANHVSHADTPAILHGMPRAMRPRTAVAAALDVFGGDESPDPSLGKRLLPWTVAAGFHAFAFDRHASPLRSVRTAVDLVRDGWSLVLYPEGTRSRDGSVGPFKAGVAVISKFTGRPVIPCHVGGGDQVMPCGRFLPKSGHLRVRFGQPLWHEAPERAEDFAERVRDHVLHLAAAPVRPAEPEPRRGVAQTRVGRRRPA